MSDHYCCKTCGQRYDVCRCAAPRDTLAATAGKPTLSYCDTCHMRSDFCSCAGKRGTLAKAGKPTVGGAKCEKVSADAVSGANDRQVGGTHWQKGSGCPQCGNTIQHWDFVLMHKMPYMEASIFGYILRWRDKGGLQDLEKAKHFLEKLIEYESNTK